MCLTETFKCRKKTICKISGIKKAVVFALIISIIFFVLYNERLLPVLIKYASTEASNKISTEIGNVLKKHCASSEYSDFVKLTYKENGDVASLETNTAKISFLTSSITNDIIYAICKDNRLKISIPLGSLSKNAIFSGRGPNINAQVLLSKKVGCNVVNEFYESGINQTVHRIVANVTVDAYIIFPMRTECTTATVKYIIAETVIVGKVPDAYTQIKRMNEDDTIEESDIDDVFDHGAKIE